MEILNFIKSFIPIYIPIPIYKTNVVKEFESMIMFWCVLVLFTISTFYYNLLSEKEVGDKLKWS